MMIFYHTPVRCSHSSSLFISSLSPLLPFVKKNLYTMVKKYTNTRIITSKIYVFGVIMLQKTLPRGEPLKETEDRGEKWGRVVSK